MSNEDLYEMSQNSDMIVCGYAFSVDSSSNIHVFDLRSPHHALVMTPSVEVLETTMDDVELSIVIDYWNKNKKFLEQSYA